MILLIAVVALLPRAASTNVGREFLAAQVNQRITGHFALESLSLSWFGPNRATGVTLSDDGDRPVLVADVAELEQGLLHTAITGGDWRALRLRDVRARLVVDEDNEVSLVQAIATPSGVRPAFGAVREIVNIQAPAIVVARQGGRLAVETEEIISAGREVSGTDQPLLTVSGLEVHQDAKGTKIKATGTADVNAVLMALGQQGGAGTLTVSADGSIADGGFEGQADVKARQLRYGSAARPAERAVDVDIQASAKLADGQTSGTIAVTGDAGQSQARFAYGGGVLPPAADLLDALFVGKRVDLPELELEVSGALDLAAIAAAVPAALPIRQDSHITRGSMLIKDLQVRGGEKALFQGGIELQNVQGRTAGGTIDLPAMSVRFDAGLEDKRGLVFREAEVGGPGVQLSVSGSLDDLQGRFDADLARLRAQLGQVLDLSGVDLSGSINGQLAVSRTDDQRLAVRLNLSAAQAELGYDNRRIALGQAQLEHTGEVVIADGSVQRISAMGTRFNINDRATGRLTGWFDPRGKLLNVRADVEQLDLAEARRLAAAFDAGDLPLTGGQAAAHLTVARKASPAVWTATGTVNLRDVMHGERRIIAATGIECDSAEYNPQTSALAVKQLNIAGDELTGRLSGELVINQLTGFDWSGLSRAALADGKFQLPTMQVQAGVNANLRKLLDVVSAFTEPPAGINVTNGKLQLTDLNVAGGERPTVRGSVSLTDVITASDSGPQQWSPMGAEFAVGQSADGRLEIRQANLQTPNISLKIKGTIRELAADVEADIAGALGDARRIVAFESPQLAGRLNGRLHTTRMGDDRARVQLACAVSDLSYLDGDRRMPIGRGEINHDGQLEWSAEALPRIVSDRTVVRLGDQLDVTASGWYALDSGTFTAKVEAQRVELAWVSQQLRDWGVADIGNYGGALRFDGDMQRVQASGAINTSGNLYVEQLLKDQSVLLADKTTCTWSEVLFDPGREQLSAKRLNVEAAMAQLTYLNAAAQLADPVSVSGEISGKADLSGCMKFYQAFSGKKEGVPLAGQASFAGRSRASGGDLTIDGTANVEDLTYGKGAEAFTQRRVKLDYQVQATPAEKRLAFKQVKVQAPALSADATGEVTDYSGVCLLSASGQYQARWKDLQAFLRWLAPSAAREIIPTGDTAGRFTLSGPLCGGEVLENLSADAELGWDTVALAGVPFGQARLSPKLSGGQLTIPQTEVAVAGGKAQLTGVIDLSTSPPLLRIPGSVAVLHRINIDKPLAESLLSRVNPIFTQLAAADGLLSLRTQEIVLPLGVDSRHGAGQGKLDLTTLNIRPQGILAELLRLGGEDTAKPQSVRVGTVDFKVRNGRIHYEDFTMVFAERLEMKFYGSVGFDDTLDLMVSLPVTSTLFDNIKGQEARKYLDLMGKARVDIPIVGTRLKPRLDLSAIDLRNVVPDPTGVLDEIFGGGRRRDAPSTSGDRQPQRPPSGGRKGVKKGPTDGKDTPRDD